MDSILEKHIVQELWENWRENKEIEWRKLEALFLYAYKLGKLSTKES